MSVQKNERALVVISEINQHAGDFAWLYNFAENAGRWQVESTLKDDYVDYVSLYDQSATKNNLVSTLKALGGKPTIKEIDLIVMLHGNTNRLVFHEGRVYMSELKSDIQGLNLAKKLRLVYSTACYGQTHINEFMGAGFSTAIGAKGINSSGATELPIFVRLWSYGIRADQALAVAD